MIRLQQYMALQVTPKFYFILFQPFQIVHLSHVTGPVDVDEISRLSRDVTSKAADQFQIKGKVTTLKKSYFWHPLGQLNINININTRAQIPLNKQFEMVQ
jgi:hypothetical protein